MRTLIGKEDATVDIKSIVIFIMRSLLYSSICFYLMQNHLGLGLIPFLSKYCIVVWFKVCSDTAASHFLEMSS